MLWTTKKERFYRNSGALYLQTCATEVQKRKRPRKEFPGVRWGLKKRSGVGHSCAGREGGKEKGGTRQNSSQESGLLLQGINGGGKKKKKG